MRASTCAIATAVLALGAAGVANADNIQGMSMSAAPAARQGHGSGVIKAIDAGAGTLTIQHGPIPAVGWPAMTMAFKAEPSTMLKTVKVGEKIKFDIKVTGMEGAVTAIMPR